MQRDHRLRGLHGASGAPLAGTSDPGDGDLPPFQRLSRLLSTFLTIHRPLFGGLGVDKTQAWCIISLSCQFVA